MKAILIISSFLFASVSSADYQNYDDIVSKLSEYQRVETELDPQPRLGMSTYSRAHVGLGLSQTFYDAQSDTLSGGVQSQGGLLINVGVDLVTRNWGIEGSFANFGTRSTSQGQARLREFSIKGLYKPRLSNSWSMRMGMGVSSRFLNVSNGNKNQEYRTPSGIFTFGMDKYINSFVSVGADFNFKTAMISETIDNNSVDLAFRVDTHF